MRRLLGFLMLFCFLLPSGYFMAADEGIPGGFAGDGFVAGNFVIYPGLELLYQFEDNVFLQPDDGNVISSGQYIIRPKIQLEMPFWNAYLKMAYSPQYRWYDKDEEINISTGWTHIVTLDSMFNTSSGLHISVRDRYVKGVLETEEFDASREVIKGKDPFVRNTAEVSLGYDLTQRFRGRVRAEFTTVSFDNDNDITTPNTFYDNETLVLGGALMYDIFPLTTVGLHAEVIQNDQDREAMDNGYDAWEVFASLKGSLSRTLSGYISAGYHGDSFDMGNFSDYSGLIVNFRLENEFSERTKLSLSLIRKPNQSAYGDNNFYASNQASVTATHRASEIVFFSLGAAFQNNDYPESIFIPAMGTSIERDDDISSIKAGMGLYLHERISVRVNYRYEDRDSNLPEFCDTNNVYIVEANIGW